MVRAKKIITIFILLLITFVSTNNVLASNFDEDTEANVSLKKSDSNTETNNNNKKPIYTTSTPKKVDLLPQTGEILASFMYIMIGLSLLIFIIGLIFNKYSMNNIEWSY